VVNGVLYAVGGFETSKPLATVQAYSPGSNSWVTRAPLPKARSYLNGAGTINGVLYVAGGSDSIGPTKTLFAYTPSTNTWTSKAPMLSPGSCGATGVIAGKLYVYTGACPQIPASFQRYDPATNTWKLLAVPTSPHRFPAAGVLNGKFYLAGGMESNGSSTGVVEAYDPATNTWRGRPPLLTPRWGGTGSVIDGLFYVTGGAGSGDLAKTTDVYDPRSSTWGQALYPDAPHHPGERRDQREAVRHRRWRGELRGVRRERGVHTR
jgi:N-acetylneuraminic acid mutarotase